MSTTAKFARATVTMMMVAAMLSLTAALQAQAQEEEAAKRQLENGRKLLRQNSYEEALKDFTAVLRNYPNSAVADDALLEIATYEFEVRHDAAGADKRADELIERFKMAHESVAKARVLKGRIALETAKTPEQVKAAITNFSRVHDLNAGTDAVPTAMYLAGEALRTNGMFDEAIRKFSDLSTEYPDSPWTARGLLGAGYSLEAASQHQRALDQLQRVRLQFAPSREAATAIEWTTILYRLSIRAPSQPPYVFSGSIGGPNGKFKDVSDVAVDHDNNLLVATKTGVNVLNSKGTLVRSIAASEPHAIVINGAGRVLTLHEDGEVREEGKPPITLSMQAADGKVKPLKLEAGVAMANGDLLVADRDLKALFRYAADGKPKGEFARQLAPHHLAISELDDVAALDTDTKIVTILDRDGKNPRRIGERGNPTQLQQPVDIAFDRLGHLYVLDRRALLVFSVSAQGVKLMASLTAPDKSADAFGTPEAMALDSAARLYVFEGRSGTVRVYR